MSTTSPARRSAADSATSHEPSWPADLDELDRHSPRRDRDVRSLTDAKRKITVLDHQRGSGDPAPRASRSGSHSRHPHVGTSSPAPMTLRLRSASWS